MAVPGVELKSSVCKVECGLSGAGGGGGRRLIRSYWLTGTEFWFCKMKRILEKGSDDGCTTMWMN